MHLNHASVWGPLGPTGSMQIADCGHAKFDEANANLIVRAVNMHDELVGALKDLLRDEKLDDDDPALVATRARVEAVIEKEMLL